MKRFALALGGALVAISALPAIAAEGGQPARPKVERRDAFGSYRPPIARPLTPPGERPPAPQYSLEDPSPETRAKIASLIVEEKTVDVRLKIDLARPRLFHTTYPIRRISVADPRVANVVQYGPKEFEIIGEGTGATTLTVWFDENEVSTLLRAGISVGRVR